MLYRGRCGLDRGGARALARLGQRVHKVTCTAFGGGPGKARVQARAGIVAIPPALSRRAIRFASATHPF